MAAYPKNVTEFDLVDPIPSTCFIIGYDDATQQMIRAPITAFSTGGGGGSVASTDITDSTTIGRSLITAADAAAARTALSLSSEVFTTLYMKDVNGNTRTLVIMPDDSGTGFIVSAV